MKTEDWVNSIIDKNPSLDHTLIEKAIEFVGAHSDKNIVQQGVNIADQLITLNCDTQTVTAGIVYPCVAHGSLSKDLITKTFGRTIQKLLANSTQLDAIHGVDHVTKSFSAQQKQADNLRKMLLAIVDDIRVVLIKLSEQLVLLKSLKQSPGIQQQQAAKRAMQIYAPLASRLGIGQMKWQLEDWAFRYLEPETYQSISKALNMRRSDRDVFIKTMIDTLQTLFKDAQIKEAHITGRAKHIYSIYGKKERKEVDLSEIYDTSAFRVIVPSIEDCYTALSVINSTWQPIKKEFDDYIAKPKPNGYRSIHTAVIGPNDINVEIQVRTQQMHDEAELGVAAHWKYKENKSVESRYEEKIALLRDVMDWQKNVSEEEPGDDTVLSKIFDDRVYVFTPNGDVFDLAAGATPLDFAYHVHTDIGHRCKGAKVNGKLVPLSTTLHTGDRVEITTAKENHPSRDWIGKNQPYLKTSAAIAKVRHWFRKQDQARFLSEGQAAWEKATRHEKFTKAQLDKVAKKFNLRTGKDVLIALGSNDLTPAAVVKQIKKLLGEHLDKKANEPIALKTQSPLPLQSSMTIEGVGNLLTQMAKCCKPIPGDSILGYITKGAGISVHQEQCRNIQQAIQHRPERVLPINWGTESTQHFAVDILLEADDRDGLIRDISNVIASEKIPLLGLSSRVNRINRTAFVQLTVEVQSLELLEGILKQLRQLPGLNAIRRS